MSGLRPLAAAGVRVLDLSRDGGAAACVRLLALLGADVHARRPVPATTVPALADDYDVVVTDLRPAEAATLGLDLATLLTPGRAVLSATAYGLDGPYADRAGPLPSWASFGPAVDDALAGAHAAVAALAALRWARRHRRGVLVEVAALEVIATCLGDLLPCPGAVTAPLPEPSASAPAAGPRARRLAVLPCADGYVGLAAPTAVDRDDLAALTGVDAVRDAAADLGCLLGPWLRERTRLEVFHAAQLWRLPVVPVLDPAEALTDEQCAARGCWVADADPPVARSPFRFAPNPVSSRVRVGMRARGALEDDSAHPDRLRPRGGKAPTARRPPLSGLRVLDLGMVWAGPYCGRLLAGLGAEVIKVEGPARPDGTRAGARGACPGLFADLNRGKASLVLDLSRSAGREVFLRLARQADVVVESFSPRVLPNFGLDYATLAAANPRLLLLSMPAFGADGPWGDYVAYGSGLELVTGLAVRLANGAPTPAPLPYLDYLAGAYGAVGLLAALLARDRDGSGAHLELAQREVACQVLATRLQRGEQPGPWSLDPAAIARDPHLATRRLFPAPTPSCPGHHYARLPWRLHGVPSARQRPAPAFGADTRRLLRDLARADTIEAVNLVPAKALG
ncbi:MAG TPA: CoA transferase [Chloroflexota bacterium]|nr:CoA transferase [Chloroflexota bacterium]